MELIAVWLLAQQMMGKVTDSQTQELCIKVGIHLFMMHDFLQSTPVTSLQQMTRTPMVPCIDAHNQIMTNFKHLPITVYTSFHIPAITLGDSMTAHIMLMQCAINWSLSYYWITLIVTFPFVTFLMLNPTVGIMSSLNCPLCGRDPAHV